MPTKTASETKTKARFLRMARIIAQLQSALPCQRYVCLRLKRTSAMLRLCYEKVD